MPRFLAVVVLILAPGAFGAEPKAGLEASPGGVEGPVVVQGAQPGAALGGFDVEVTLLEYSGLYFGGEAYQNVAALLFTPRYALGERFFEGRWGEPLTLSAELLLETELAGHDGRFRGARFSSTELLRDTPGESYSFEGPEKHLLVSDLGLALSHGELWVIPRAEVKLSGGVKVALPTSRASQVATLVMAPSASLGLSRAFGRFGVRYDARATRYFFGSSVAPIAYREGAAVMVNGQPHDPEQLGSSTVANPAWGLSNALGASVELPRSFSVSAEYALIHTWLHPLAGCAVPGVETADTCRDGAALGGVQRVGQRDTQSFWLEAAWRPKGWLTLAVGASTYRPVRALDQSIANPFLSVTADNYSTVYASVAFSAAGIVEATRRAPVTTAAAVPSDLRSLENQK